MNDLVPHPIASVLFGLAVVAFWPNRQWSQWCVSVYTTRADLPLFSQSTLRTLAFRKEEAVAEAKQSIDRLLQS